MSFRIDLDRIDRRQLVPGLILIAIGVLGLFGAFGWLGGLGGLVGAVLFGAAAYFAFLQGRHSGKLMWHAAALPLAGLAVASVAPEPLGGFAFLGSIGAAFALAWRDDARRWWAVIPAGTLFSLAITALVDGTTRGAAAGGFVFFAGLAATFFVLTRLPQYPQSWAIFPAGALAVLAVVALTTNGGWVVPLLLIAAGAWMLFRPNRAGAAAPRPATSVSVARPASTAPTAPVSAVTFPVVQTPIAQTPVAQAPAATPEAPPAAAGDSTVDPAADGAADSAADSAADTPADPDRRGDDIR